ncbi:NAD-dependent epimerase/dehydratase family protein [Amycolatopsis australiensis]|uniref:Nucleoside-diphosphate-sugar epimerase n=1 Tax=Amycolatopsis australiensis TaxID=546364 RepID=A0A1K1RU33_9PSEU|nr:NAD-dependent epimerase/dehydratase family protein [Amycolatopsis australiensis]SFW75333.1 Nucleoside-diphosphate-sugar epimerase [Amycolatopsis australiensis]
MHKICVIGGSRYFGRRLVLDFRDAGADVTVVNRGSVPAPPGVRHLVTDRAALARLLRDASFDVVVDQVCYTPVHAAAAVAAFRDRTRRYVLTSTIEVYAGLDAAAPLPETAADPLRHPVRPDLPWARPGYLDAHYAEGKRQAEAVFAATAPFEVAVVRAGHVLGGDDFTGRLRHYTDRIRHEQPVLVRPRNHPSSFIHHAEIARFLRWAAESGFTGPVNACSHGEFDVTELCARIGARAGREPVFGTGESPFAFDRYYGMANDRAESLGFSFSRTGDWLPGVIGEALEAT